jgi:hypothetical protein
MRICLLVLSFSYCISSFSQLDSTIKDLPTYIKVGEDSLFANLIIPENAKQIVLIIAGSGPTDNDGNNPLGMNENYSYKMLAHQLYKNDIASIRYDKRAIALSASAYHEGEDFQFNYFIEDAILIVAYIKQKYPDKKIIIAGHSQGSLVGILAAQKILVDGFISLAGAGFSIDIIFKKQFSENYSKWLPEYFKEEYFNAIDSLKKGIHMDSINSVLSIPVNLQLFMTQWMSYEPLEEINKLTIPVLVINGSNDIQVGVDNAERLVSEKKEYTLKIIEGMSHVLKDAPIDKEEHIKTYNNINLPLNSEMVNDVVKFIKKIN